METVVFRVEPSHSVTRQIGEDAGLLGDELDRVVDMAAGNPGAMHMLLELKTALEEINPKHGFEIVLACLKVKNLTGHVLYSFIKQNGIAGSIMHMQKAGWL